MSDRMERIRANLVRDLMPSELIVEDESHKHAGHAGARDGRGHFRVRIVSPQFSGLALLKRHQLVYGSLGQMMHTDIHALALDTRAPEEIP